MSKKVLLVDDDPDFIQAVTVLLEAKDFVVVSANGGEEGFVKAQSEKPDLISLDIMMEHDSKGFDISQKLKSDESTKNIPVIIVSGIKKASNFAFDYETGETLLPVKAILEKPIDPEYFLKIVEQYIQ